MNQRLLAGIAGVGTALLCAGVAAADPEPPPDPAAQPDAPAGLLPADLFGGVLALSAPPPVDPLAGVEMLWPQYYRMPAGEQASPYVLQTDVPPGPFARVDAVQGAHALIHGGLGRLPGGGLGQPLPGTDPPPGTAIPPGLEQFYIDPAAPPPPPG